MLLEDLIEEQEICSYITDEQVRNRAIANLIGIKVALEFFSKNGINVSVNNAAHKIKKVFEELDIADIYIGDIRFDVRLSLSPDEFAIPKKHFEYNITPDVYMLVVYDEILNDVKVAGFITPENIQFTKSSEKYYIITPKDITPTEKTAEIFDGIISKTRKTLPLNAKKKALMYLDNLIVDKKEFFEEFINSEKARQLLTEYIAEENILRQTSFKFSPSVLIEEELPVKTILALDEPEVKEPEMELEPVIEETVEKFVEEEDADLSTITFDEEEEDKEEENLSEEDVDLANFINNESEEIVEKAPQENSEPIIELEPETDLEENILIEEPVSEIAEENLELEESVETEEVEELLPLEITTEEEPVVETEEEPILETIKTDEEENTLEIFDEENVVEEIEEETSELQQELDEIPTLDLNEEVKETLVEEEQDIPELDLQEDGLDIEQKADEIETQELEIPELNLAEEIIEEQNEVLEVEEEFETLELETPSLENLDDTEDNLQLETDDAEQIGTEETLEEDLQFAIDDTVEELSFENEEEDLSVEEISEELPEFSFALEEDSNSLEELDELEVENSLPEFDADTLQEEPELANIDVTDEDEYIDEYSEASTGENNADDEEEEEDKFDKYDNLDESFVPDFAAGEFKLEGDDESEELLEEDVETLEIEELTEPEIEENKDDKIVEALKDEELGIDLQATMEGFVNTLEPEAEIKEIIEDNSELEEISEDDESVENEAEELIIADVEENNEEEYHTEIREDIHITEESEEVESAKNTEEAEEITEENSVSAEIEGLYNNEEASEQEENDTEELPAQRKKPKSGNNTAAAILIVLLAAVAGAGYMYKDMIMEKFFGETSATDSIPNELAVPKTPPVTPKKKKAEPKQETEAEKIINDIQEEPVQLLDSSVSVSNLVVECDVPSSFVNNQSRRYLMKLTKRAQLQLKNALLIANEQPLSNKIIVDLSLENNVIKFERISDGGDSKNINKIIEQTVADVLENTPPYSGTFGENKGNIKLILRF